MSTWGLKLRIIELIKLHQCVNLWSCLPSVSRWHNTTNLNPPHNPLEHVSMLLRMCAAGYKSKGIFISYWEAHIWQTGSGRRNLRCRRGSRCWLRMRGHRLWTQNAPRRNSSLRTSASAAYTHPPHLSPGREEEKKKSKCKRAWKNKRAIKE